MASSPRRSPRDPSPRSSGPPNSPPCETRNAPPGPEGERHEGDRPGEVRPAGRPAIRGHRPARDRAGRRPGPRARRRAQPLRLAHGARRPLRRPAHGSGGADQAEAPCGRVDGAGVVEAVGANVRDLRPGDEVLGRFEGSFAEYARAEADRVVPKPARLTFEQAAAVPMAGQTALRAIRDVGQVRAGHRVLINGAAGGVGSFAVQIATALGAEVTGVCSSKNVELVRSLGAAHVIDYTEEDFTDGLAKYDVVHDNVGNRPLRRLR